MAYNIQGLQSDGSNSPLLSRSSSSSSISSCRSNDERPQTQDSHRPIPLTPANPSSRGNRITPRDLHLILQKIEQEVLPHRKAAELKKQAQKIKDSLGIETELRNLSYKNLEVLKKSFEEISRILPTKKLGELAYITSRLLRAEHLEANKDENYSKQLKKYQMFEQPSAAKTKGVSANVGISTGFTVSDSRLGPYASANVSLGATSTLSADDEAQIVKDTTVSTGIAGNAGLGATFGHLGVEAVAGVSGSASYTNFSEWPNARTFINTQQTDVRDPTPSVKARFLNLFRPKAGYGKLQRAEQEMANSLDRMRELLLQLNLGEVSVVASYPEQFRPLSGRLTNVSGLITANALVNNTPASVFEMAGAGATGSASYTAGYQTIPATFFSIIKDQPQKSKEFPEPMTRYASKIYHSYGRRDPIITLSALFDEIKGYCKVVERYDYLKKTPFRNKQEQKELKAFKHRIENAWGVVGRHQFLQYAAASQAWLAALLIEQKGSYEALDPEERKFFESTSEYINNPPIQYSKKKFNEIANFEYLVNVSVLNKSFTADISAGVFNGKVTVSRITRTHPSRLRTGEYLDFTLTGQLAASAQGLLDHALLTGAIQGALPAEFLPDHFEIVPDVGITGQIATTVRYFKPQYSQDPKYTGEKGWRKQFERNSETFIANPSLSATAPTAGINVTGGIGFTATTREIPKEKISPYDLTYTMTRFNRFYRNNKFDIHNLDWNNFFDLHKEQYQEMFQTLNNHNSPMYREILFYLSELKEMDPSQVKELDLLKTQFDEAISRYTRTRDERTFMAAKEKFELLLEKFISPWWANHRSHWNLLAFTKDETSGQSIPSRLARQHCCDRRTQLRFESLSEEDSLNLFSSDGGSDDHSPLATKL